MKSVSRVIWLTSNLPLSGHPHANIDTTMKYYVGRNAQKAAEAVWGTVAGTGDIAGDTSKTEDKPNNRQSV